MTYSSQFYKLILPKSRDIFIENEKKLWRLKTKKKSIQIKKKGLYLDSWEFVISFIFMEAVTTYWVKSPWRCYTTFIDRKI